MTTEKVRTEIVEKLADRYREAKAINDRALTAKIDLDVRCALLNNSEITYLNSLIRNDEGITREE